MKDQRGFEFGFKPGLPPRERAEAARLGLWLGIIALSMVFLGLTGSLIVSRSATARWPPEGVRLNLPLGCINTGLILASSAALAAGLRRGRQGQADRMRPSLQLGGALALSFLGLQALQYYWLIRNFHQTLSASQFGTYFYALTGLHALHLLGGVGWLSWLTTGGKKSLLAVELCARYWHFVTLLWVYLFTVLYLW